MSKAPAQLIEPAVHSSHQLLIDEEVTKHEESIRRSRSLRNTHAPVSKVPHEVLSHIFDIAANWPRSKSFRELPCTPVERFNFSFVCQHWRMVSVGTPKIWCFITSNYSERWTQALLERSKMSKLTYHASTSYYDRGPRSCGAVFVKEVLQGHLHRIQELKLDSSVWEAHAFWEALPPSAPCLRTLKIRNSSFPIDFPGKIFQDTQLSTLEVNGGCRLDWKSSLLPQLKHLKIKSVTLPPYNEFIGALRRMPDLLTLDIDADEVPDFESAQISEPVTLAKLQRFRLSCSFDGLLDILHCLRVPTETVLDLICQDGPDAVDFVLSTLTASLNKFFESMICKDGQKLEYSELQLKRFGEDEIGYQAWQKPRSATPPFEHKGEVDFRLELLWLLPADAMLRIIPLVQPLSRLSTLGISQIDDMVVIALAVAFEQLPTLEMLVLDDDCFVEVLAMLSYEADSTTEDVASTSNGRLLFANLQTLCLEQVTFSTTFIKNLQDCLIQRYEYGVPICQLVIKEGFKIFVSEVSSLREIVHVEWDGVERIDPDIEHLYLYGPYPGYEYGSD